jgi:peptide/nickel transport system substrate-binding protein
MDSDRGLSGLNESKLTREQLLRRSAVLAGGAALATGGFGRTAEAALAAAPKPRRGGTLRYGGAGGSSKDFMDPGTSFSDVDQARNIATWETLSGFDPQGNVVLNGLAQEFSTKTGDVWTIRLHPGIEFHNGKTLTADDVIYHIRRMLDPKLSLIALAQLGAVDPNQIKKMDKYTVRLTLKQKDVLIKETLANPQCGIGPAGYSPTAAGAATVAQQIGTGPYKLKNFTPGQQSTHVRFANYWRTGQPYLDQVVISDLTDDTARVNALVGGQVDAITQVPGNQVSAVNGHAGTHVLLSPGQTFGPLLMRVDTAPFNDVRVRQAMRLLANRPQMVQLALGGYGTVGKDIASPFDPAYDKALPQRHQDIQQAQSLLKAAGQSNLNVDLVTAPVINGIVDACTVFAQNASAGGVKVNVKVVDSGVLYGPQYLKWPFSVDYYSGSGYLQQTALWMLPTSPYNETGWPDAAHQQFTALYNQARQTVDDTKRAAIIHQMQQMEYDAGGAIIWGFTDHVDGYTSKVAGLNPHARTKQNMNNYAWGFRTIWLTA